MALFGITNQLWLCKVNHRWSVRATWRMLGLVTSDYCLPRASLAKICQIDSSGCFGWTFDAGILDSSFQVNLTHNGKCCGCSSDSAAFSRVASGSAQRASSFAQVIPIPMSFCWCSKHVLLPTLRYPKITPSWDVEGRHINVTEAVQLKHVIV